MERKLLGKSFQKSGYTSQGLENTVPFSTGSCRKCKPDFLVEWKAPKVTKQIEVIHSVLTESLITAWQSRNGNENFLTWNSKFRWDQTDQSKRTTCGSGPLSPQAAQQRTLFIFIHSLINSKSNELPQSLGSLCFDQKISTRKEAFHLFLNRNFRNFWHDGKNPRGRSETKGLETVIIGNDTAVTLVGVGGGS